MRINQIDTEMVLKTLFDEIDCFVAENEFINKKYYSLFAPQFSGSFAIKDFEINISEGNTFLKSKLDRPKESLPLSLSQLSKLGINIPTNKFIGFTLDVNKYFRNVKSIELRRFEIDSIKEKKENKSLSDTELTMALMNTLAAISRRRNKEIEILNGAKQLTIDYFRSLNILNKLNKKWQKESCLTFRISFPSIKKSIDLNLKDFVAFGCILVDVHGYIVSSKIGVIPYRGSDYYLPLDSNILTEKGILILNNQIKYIIAKLLQVKYLEEAIRANETICLKTRIELYEEFGFIMPDMETLLFHRGQCCEELKFEMLKETPSESSVNYYSYSNDKLQYAEPRKQEPGIVERAIAYGLFGGAVQAGKRTIMSDSFTGSASNAILTGLLAEAGLRIMGKK